VSDPALDELWAKVSARWDDDKAHAAFLELCRLQGALSEAAARYRRARDASDDEAERELLQKRLAGIALVAMLELEAARSTETPREVQLAQRVLRWIVLLLCLAALVVLGLMLAR
jgi:hypothetical protein